MLIVCDIDFHVKDGEIDVRIDSLFLLADYPLVGLHRDCQGERNCVQ